MPIKWKIFRIFIIIQLCFVSILLIYNLNNMFKVWRIVGEFGDVDFIYPTLFMTFSLIFLDFFSLFLLQNKFPNKELKKNELIVFKLLHIINIVTTILTTAILLFSFFEMISNIGEENAIPENKTPYLWLLLFDLGLFYLVIFSGQLKNLIQRNYSPVSLKDIEMIGEPNQF